jgi:cysteinyl-tRNA synthetase
MHVGHIDINNEKMSKSVGNFVLVKDLLKKYSGGDIR